MQGCGLCFRDLGFKGLGGGGSSLTLPQTSMQPRKGPQKFERGDTRGYHRLSRAFFVVLLHPKSLKPKSLTAKPLNP